MIKDSPEVEGSFGICKLTFYYKGTDFSKEMICASRTPHRHLAPTVTCGTAITTTTTTTAAAGLQLTAQLSLKPCIHLYYYFSCFESRKAWRTCPLIGQRLSNLAGLHSKSIHCNPEHKDEL